MPALLLQKPSKTLKPKIILQRLKKNESIMAEGNLFDGLDLPELSNKFASFVKIKGMLKEQ